MRVRVQILIQYMWFEDIKERKRERERKKQSPGKVAQLHGICAISYTCPSFLSITCGFYINLNTGTYSTHMHDNTTGVSGKIYKEDITRIMQQPNCNFIARPANMCTHYKIYMCIPRYTCIACNHLQMLRYEREGIIPID